MQEGGGVVNKKKEKEDFSSKMRKERKTAAFIQDTMISFHLWA